MTTIKLFIVPFSLPLPPQPSLYKQPENKLEMSNKDLPSISILINDPMRRVWLSTYLELMDNFLSFIIPWFTCFLVPTDNDWWSVQY